MINDLDNNAQDWKYVDATVSQVGEKGGVSYAQTIAKSSKVVSWEQGSAKRQ